MNPPRLAWFSPLPPDSSEIGEHTRRIQDELRRRYEVEFWKNTEDGLLNETRGKAFGFSHKGASGDFWRDINGIDVPVYNIGNNGTFHGNIWWLSREKPGIVVLHDTKLHHLFGYLFRETSKEHDFYVEKMAQYYGETGRRAAESFWRCEISTEFMADYFPLTPLATENALAIVAHTSRACDALRRETNVPVRLAPLPYASEESRLAARAAVHTSSLDNRRARLIIFGHLGLNRRLAEMLVAWAAMPERDRFELDVFGTLPHAGEIKILLARLGMERNVTIRGFVPTDELDEFLARADLAINLRYPSMGEASASQLRIWNHALPTMVTLTESYADMPEDTVFFVHPHREQEDIQRHFRDLLAHPDVFRQKGLRGKEVLAQQHSPSAYVDQIAFFCDRIAGLRTRHTQSKLGARVGETAGAWMQPGAAGNARDRYYAQRIQELISKQPR